MKKIQIALLALTLLTTHQAYAADDINQVLGEVDQLQNTLEEKTPDELKGVFAKVEAWRVKEAQVFVKKRDEQDAILHPEGDEKKFTFNEEGNIEIQTGVSEAKSNPKAATLFYLYLILAFIFSTMYLFYTVAVLLVLAVLKMLVRAVGKKKE